MQATKHQLGRSETSYLGVLHIEIWCMAVFQSNVMNLAHLTYRHVQVCTQCQVG